MSESFGNIEAILDRFPPQPEHLISALQDVQDTVALFLPDRGVDQHRAADSLLGHGAALEAFHFVGILRVGNSDFAQDPGLRA